MIENILTNLIDIEIENPIIAEGSTKCSSKSFIDSFMVRKEKSLFTLIFQVLEDNLNGLVITFVMMLIIMIFVIMTKEIVVALMLE